MLKYSVQVIWSDEDEAFLATIPELPGLSAFGDTQEEATQEAITIAQDMIEIKEEDGDPIPNPHKKREYSGQFRLRLPQSLHESLSVEADREGLSLNSYLIYLITKQSTVHSIEKLYIRESLKQRSMIKEIRDSADENYYPQGKVSTPTGTTQDSVRLDG